MANVTLNNSDIVKGSMLMLFVDAAAAPIAFATSHSISFTTNTSEVSTKDHGASPAVIANSISWEITAENLYSDTGIDTLMTLMNSMQPVTVSFAKISATEEAWKPGIVTGASATNWSASSSHVIASGKALITSLSVNAPAGDNATISATFTGNGGFTMDFS